MLSPTMAQGGRIYFTPSVQLKAYLNALTRMGIYGKQRGDVINHILGEEVMRLMENHTLDRLPPEAEIKDEEIED